MIVALTSCIVAILAQSMVVEEQGKVIAGVLTGIGFLGAGCILKQNDHTVVGTATGASIWASAVVGLALGYGFYVLSLAAFAGIAIILIGGGIFMEKFNNQKDKEDIE